MKRAKFLFKSIFILFAILLTAFFAFYFVNVQIINNAFKSGQLFASDIEALASGKSFNGVISANINLETSSLASAKIDFKLFDLFKIKTKTVEVVPDKDVLAAGSLVAFTLNPGGVIITKIKNVETALGEVKTIDGNLMIGDIIEKVNGKPIVEIADLQTEISKGETLVLSVLRAGKAIDFVATPELEIGTEVYRLGLTISDDIAGIGTLTFIDEQTGAFGALGHSINKNASAVKTGIVRKASIIGVEKGSAGKAGEIKAYEAFGAKNNLGEVNKCTNKGVFGVIKNSDYIKKFVHLKTGGRYTVVPGDAQILCDIDGSGPKAYNIKIVKAAHQTKADEKGMVIKVTDKTLLNKTGGIIQGMSGSPIIQNGRLVGAVTHVFLNDSTKGYGIYLDSMLSEIGL